MESRSKERIVELLEQLIVLLDQHNEGSWSNMVKALLDNYVNLIHSETKQEAARVIISSITGGMGTFGDLVLYGNNKPLLEENRRLDYLTDELYKECKLILYKRLSARIADTFLNSEYHTHELTEDYTVYRNFSEGEILGKFYWRPRLNADEMDAPIEEDYAVILPRGTLTRFGTVATPEGVSSKGWIQIYVERPARSPEIRVIKNDDSQS